MISGLGFHFCQVRRKSHALTLFVNDHLAAVFVFAGGFDVSLENGLAQIKRRRGIRGVLGGRLTLLSCDFRHAVSQFVDAVLFVGRSVRGSGVQNHA